MKFPLFISTRYIFSNKDSRLLNLISVIAVAGINLGVATLIIALSVLNGFENTLTKKITDFDSHIRISSFNDDLPNYKYNIDKISQRIGDQVDFISPFVSKLAIISSKYRKEGINLQGLIENQHIKRIKSNIILGQYAENSDTSILLGKTLATKLLVKPGDKVKLFALKNDKLPSPTDLPNIRVFIISGIYESGMAEFDNMIGFTSLKAAQSLFSMQDKINGLDIKLKSVTKIDSLSTLIRKELKYPYYARTIFEIHRNIFTWIDLQKKPIPIVLGLIIIVAVFNIISTLLMLVLEKTKSIGILKSLGAKSREIIRIFLYQGIYLSLIGIIAGNILAWILMSIQLKFNIIKIPSSVYFVTRVPIEMDIKFFVLISVITFILSLISAILPSYFASRTNPVTALRFE
ncbi:MAG: ABC transporter permease [Ignavibacterium sp.]|jgi:lipoprotein-releasing system permease protein|nr:ABC transporter permease [Ignavibacterium sp.]MDX9712872.1 ABC transporter permease [Ignavibacteriaceae bacterium]MEB2353777.1 ABC transporter permease [Ignavibacteriales bacterium]